MLDGAGSYFLATTVRWPPTKCASLSKTQEMGIHCRISALLQTFDDEEMVVGKAS